MDLPEQLTAPDDKHCCAGPSNLVITRGQPNASDEHHPAIARTRRVVRILISNCAFPYSVPEFNTRQILELSSARVGRTS